MLADHFDEPEDAAVGKVEQFEKEVKEQFINEPGQMRLLIVVDKLLTGFDAPSATYLYIDKKMQDHGLFQAICRVNRLDGDDKDYGYIIDYRDLFNSLETAITDYTSGALDGYDEEDIEGLLSDRIDKAREDLDEALEKIRALCEPVAPPKGTLQYQQYFCATEQGNAEQLKANEPKRVELYKQSPPLTRAYANLANEMAAAGYTRRRGRRDQGRGRPLRRRARRSEARRWRGRRLQAVRSRACGTCSTPTSAPNRPRRLRLRRHRPDPTHRPARRRRDRQAAGRHQEGPRGRRRDDHQQHAQGDHRRAAAEPEVLRQDVRAPRRHARRTPQGRAGLQGSTSPSCSNRPAKLGKGESDTEYPEWADNGARKALVDFFARTTHLAIEVDTAVLHTKPDCMGRQLDEGDDSSSDAIRSDAAR